MQMDKTKYLEFIRFCCVGCIATVVDIVVFNVFNFFAPYQVCVVAGFGISWIFNYYLSAKWTFREKPTTKNFLSMFIAHIANLVIVKMGLMYLFVDVIGLNERLVYIPTLGIAAVTSFIMVRLAFKMKKRKEEL